MCRNQITVIYLRPPEPIANVSDTVSRNKVKNFLEECYNGIDWNYSPRLKPDMAKSALEIACSLGPLIQLKLNFGGNWREISKEIGKTPQTSRKYYNCFKFMNNHPEFYAVGGKCLNITRLNKHMKLIEEIFKIPEDENTPVYLKRSFWGSCQRRKP